MTRPQRLENEVESIIARAPGVERAGAGGGLNWLMSMGEELLYPLPSYEVV